MSGIAVGVLALLAAFALGAIPTAYLAARLIAGVDIREIGSGNPGTFNAGAHVGKAAGVGVLLIDAGKGVLAVVLAQALASADYWAYGAAVAATAGHNFSPFLRFKGGKGAATAFGVAAYILPGITALSIISGALMLMATRKPIVAVIWIFFSANAIAIATGQDAGLIAMCLAVSALVLGTHIARGWGELRDAARARDWRRAWAVVGG